MHSDRPGGTGTPDMFWICCMVTPTSTDERESAKNQSVTEYISAVYYYRRAGPEEGHMVGHPPLDAVGVKWAFDVYCFEQTALCGAIRVLTTLYFQSYPMSTPVHLNTCM
jgi:hypothetical protein